MNTLKVDRSHILNIRFSQRELEVLRLLVEGCSNKEIATALNLSPNTIKTHIRSLMNKLGVEHRLQIVILVLRHNLI